MSAESSYYVPAQSRWPIIASIGLFMTAVGAANIINAGSANESTGMSWLVFPFLKSVYKTFFQDSSKTKMMSIE